MVKFLIFTLDLEPGLYYKASCSLDLILMILSIFAYFSDEIIVSYSMDLALNIFTCLFGAIAICSLIKHLNETPMNNILFKAYAIGKILYHIILIIFSCIIFNRINMSKFRVIGFLFVSIILFVLYLVNALSIKGLISIIFSGEDEEGEDEEYTQVQNDYENENLKVDD